MPEHPKLHDKTTLCVERQKRFGRVDYSPCNQIAEDFLAGFKQKSFSPDDLRFVKSLGYAVLIIGSETKEF